MLDYMVFKYVTLTVPEWLMVVISETRGAHQIWYLYSITWK